MLPALLVLLLDEARTALLGTGALGRGIDEPCAAANEQLWGVLAEVQAEHTVDGQVRRGFMLTSCDAKCLVNLFPIWAEAARNTRDGDLTKHLVVICLGREAYDACISLQGQKSSRHQCVADECQLPSHLGNAPDNSGEYKFRDSRYMWAVLQKDKWVMAALELGVSVAWVDIDLNLYGDPLRFMLHAAPDADAVLAVENWRHDNLSFSGPVCKRPLSQDGTDACSRQRFNAGLYLVNPTPAGRSLVRLIAAIVYHVTFAAPPSRRLPPLEQALVDVLLARWTSPQRIHGISVPLSQWDGSRHVQYAELVPDPSLHPNIYYVSPQVFSSRCMGICGIMAPGKSFRHYRQGPNKSDVVCVMPRSAADRLISMHQNCVKGLERKMATMRALINITVDEAQYESEKTRLNRSIYPVW